MSYRDYSAAKGLIVDATGHGDFTTIQSAITASVSGQTIFVRPGTYTENITLKAGTSLTSFSQGNAVIVGKMTISSAGTYYVSDLQMTTNSDFCLVVSGSGVVSAQFKDVTVLGTNNTAISVTNSNTGTTVNFFESFIAAGSSGQAIYAMTSVANIGFFNCVTATSGSTTAASNSAGNVSFYNCTMATPHSLSSTGAINISECRIDTASLNTACIVLSGTSIANVFMGELFSGTASCVTVGAGCTLTSSHLAASSSNAHVFTGAGTWVYAYTSFTGASSVHNVSTETALVTF